VFLNRAYRQKARKQTKYLNGGLDTSETTMLGKVHR